MHSICVFVIYRNFEIIYTAPYISIKLQGTAANSKLNGKTPILPITIHIITNAKVQAIATVLLRVSLSDIKKMHIDKSNDQSIQTSPCIGPVLKVRPSDW